MSVQDNKHIVRKFFGYFELSDIDSVLNLMAEDATWWVNGKPHLFAGSGIKTKRQMEKIWHDMYSTLDGVLRMTLIDMLGEDDRVAAEVRSHASLKSGKVYENDYHFLVRLRDGKIVEVKEYADMMHAAEVFG